MADPTPSASSLKINFQISDFDTYCVEVKGYMLYGFLIALVGIFVQRKIPNGQQQQLALNGSRFGDKVLLKRKGDARVKIKLV